MNYVGILESVAATPGRFDAVVIRLEGDIRTHLLNLYSGHIVCGNKDATIPDFFEWLSKQRVGKVKAVLVPSLQHYGRIDEAFFEEI